VKATNRALVLHCVRLDVVEAAGRGESSLFSGVLLSSLVGVLAGGATRGMASAEGLPLAFLFVGLFALLDAVGDAATTFLDPRDVPLLRTLAVRPGAYLRARLTALLLPITIKGTALALPLALAGAIGGRRLAPLALVPVVLLLEVWLAAAAVALLVAARRVVPSFVRLRDLLVWARVLFLLAGTGAWLLFLRGTAGGSGLARFAELRGLPTTWFAHLGLLVTGDPGAQAPLAAAAAAACALAAVLLVVAAPGYVRLLDRFEQTEPSRARPRRRWLARLFERGFVHPEERPTFRLGMALLRRERTFRIQTYPLLAYPLLFLALGRGADDHGLFAFLFANLPALVMALAAAFLRHSDAHRGGFWMACFRGELGSALATGSRKALWLAVVLPLELLVTLLVASDRGVAFGIAAGAVALAFATAVVATAHAPEPELPFAAPFRGRIDPGSDGARVFALLVVVVLLALLEVAVAKSGEGGLAGLAAAGLAATVVLLRRPPRPRSAAPGAPRWSEGDDVVAAKNRAPFPVRLKRELLGLAVFFGLSAVALTVLFALV
jgi:hypothetical protein